MKNAKNLKKKLFVIYHIQENTINREHTYSDFSSNLSLKLQYKIRKLIFKEVKIKLCTQFRQQDENFIQSFIFIKRIKIKYIM